MALRDHEPFVIEDFNGLWIRGDRESVPSDHFIQATNIQYIHSGFETRDGLDHYQTTVANLGNILRIYNYTMQNGQSLLVLTEGGNIYHLIGTDITYGPILHLPQMEDFGFVAYNGRAYITPFKTFHDANGLPYELGLPNDYVYVYMGDGTQARPAGGNPPVGSALIASLGAATIGNQTDAGFHLIAVVYETNTGHYTALGPQVFAGLSFSGAHEIVVSNIPVSPDAYVKKRHLVTTKWIPEYNGDQTGYQFYFIPNGTINDNTTTTKSVTFFDADLIDDASHLIDNFTFIPAGVNLTIYHSRLVVVGEYGIPETLADLPVGVTDNRSVARLSMAGEPEAVSKVDGLIIVPLDGAPLTNAQEIRDILYLFKKSRTYAYSDDTINEPAAWKEEALDQAMGAPVHGVGIILDSGGINVDYLIIADISGLVLFNGTYSRPELSWKIEDFWKQIGLDGFRQIQVLGDTVTKKIWITMPEASFLNQGTNRTMVLHADFGNGLDAKNIRWAIWVFLTEITSVCYIEPKKIVFAAKSQCPGLYVLSSAMKHDKYFIIGDYKIIDPTIRTPLIGE